MSRLAAESARETKPIICFPGVRMGNTTTRRERGQNNEEKDQRHINVTSIDRIGSAVRDLCAKGKDWQSLDAFLVRLSRAPTSAVCEAGLSRQVRLCKPQVRTFEVVNCKLTSSTRVDRLFQVFQASKRIASGGAPWKQ